MEVKSILEEQGRERWMVVQGIWLVPTLETVFLEQALKGKGVLDRGFCSEQACSPVASAVFQAPVSLQWEVLRRREYRGMRAGRPHWSPPWGPWMPNLGDRILHQMQSELWKVSGDGRSLSTFGFGEED